MIKIIIIFISIFYSYLVIFNAVVFADQDWYLNNIYIHEIRMDNDSTKFHFQKNHLIWFWQYNAKV